MYLYVQNFSSNKMYQLLIVTFIPDTMIWLKIEACRSQCRFFKGITFPQIVTAAL